MHEPTETARLRVTISRDGLEAWAQLVPQHAIPPEISEIRVKLDELGIVEGLLEEEIERMSISPPDCPVLVARGIDPIPGRPDQIDYFFSQSDPDFVPLETDDGRVDHREGRVIPNVVPGQVLARKIPGKPGQPGRSVKGQLIAPPPIKHATLLVGKNVRLSLDQLEAIADAAGFPELDKRRVSVKPVLTVDNVDFGTGNISFPGSVVVLGNVANGFAVRALEDILVHGYVEGASLEAGGGIRVAGAVRAHSLLRAQGPIKVRYVDSECSIETQSDLWVEDDALHSYLTAAKRVFIGRHLIGGVVRAGELIQAEQMGTVHHTRTQLEVIPPRIQEALGTVWHEIGELESQILKIDGAIYSLMARGRLEDQAMLKRLTPTKISLNLRLAELRRQATDLEAVQARPVRPRIIVRSGVFPGVTMVLNDRTHRPRDHERARTYTEVEGQLRVYPTSA